MRERKQLENKAKMSKKEEIKQRELTKERGQSKRLANTEENDAVIMS
jgi:hypothetical protein